MSSVSPDRLKIIMVELDVPHITGYVYILISSHISCLTVLWYLSEMSQKQMTSSMAIAGAVMGAVLALFLITVFTIVLLTARKAPPPTYTDKV